MKLLGHPVHPLLIHFPTALLPMDLALSIMYFTTGNISYGLAGFYCLVGAVLVGCVAMITGVIDLILIPKQEKQALTMGIYHACINGVVLIAFALITYRAWHAYPQMPLPSAGNMVVKGVLILALFVGNYLGGTLIYRHHIGIER